MSNNSEINHDLSKIQFNHKNTLNFTQPHGKSTIFKSIKAKSKMLFAPEKDFASFKLLAVIT